MDGAVDAAYRLGLTFRDRELPVALGIGHGPDGLGLTLGLENGLLADGLGSQDQRLLLALGFRDGGFPGAIGLQHDGPAVSLGLHLLVHGVHYVGRRVDPLDFDSDDLHAPLVGGVVEHLAEGHVDVVT